jgi:hypothetical protein
MSTVDSIRVIGTRVREYWPTVDLRLVGPRSQRPDLALGR